jgi:hypothetical protein
MPPPVFQLPATHRRRLREVWRSAGWPYQDLIEVELLAAGLLERRADPQGRETLRVTDAGLQVLAQTLQRNRAAMNDHEALVDRVALEMQRAGRVVWRGLALRSPLSLAQDAAEPSPDEASAPWTSDLAGLAPLGDAAAPATRWAMAVPDVFSIRHTTREALVEPIVHEIKVRRADLLSDLRHAAKRAAYLGLSSQCWYVLKAGIAEPEELPPECGVMVAHLPAGAGGGLEGAVLEVLRPAPRRAHRIAFATWMALARAMPEPPAEEGPQALF